jgi:hypothetical protein
MTSLKVAPQLSIETLQEEFQNFYPHLKLQFFSKAHGLRQSSPAKFIVLDRERTLASLNPNLEEKEVDISPLQSAWELEQQFEEHCGLHVQLFRQSGGLWLETSRTDQHSLAWQESHAMETLLFEPDVDAPIDYREQD